MIRRPPRSTLFPHTPPFGSIAAELSGLLPDDEVRALSSLSARRQARRDAKRRGGRRAKRAMTDLQQTASELAFHRQDRKSTRLNSSHANISYAVFCLKKKNT